MHETDLVAINDITRVLSVYTCQQGVYPRGHVLPLRLPPDLFNDTKLCILSPITYTVQADFCVRCIATVTSD
jgi:hypothetical protein